MDKYIPKKQDKDLEEILVDLPITDGEIFAHLFFGKKPVERPIKMTRRNYKSLKRFATVCLAGTFLMGAISLYSSAIQEHGSISNAYKAFMQQVEKWPATMYNP